MFHIERDRFSPRILTPRFKAAGVVSSELCVVGLQAESCDTINEIKF